MHIRIKKGLDLPLSGAPEQQIESRAVSAAALIGLDYIGLKPTLLVEEGQRVRLGEPLFRDKTHPEVIFTSPGTGVVESISRGHRRVLRSVIVRLEGDGLADAESFTAFGESGIDRLQAGQVKDQLLQSGLWTAIRTRPYSKIPGPESEPHAIFVTAMDSNPLAADPSVVMQGREQDFAAGVKVLGKMTTGKVYVCTGAEHELQLPGSDQLVHARFSGPHPAGLPGTHIHFLSPVSATRMVWQLNYQDVIAIGHLFLSGQLDVGRVISLAGPRVLKPRLIRTRVGASIRELLKGELHPGRSRAISGSVLSGRRAADWSSYLGRYHAQVTVISEEVDRKFLAFMRPGPEKYSFTRTFASSLFGAAKRFAMSASQEGSPRAMVPIGTYEDVMPMDILPTQLLRAILIRDTDEAQQLGCLELDEEDVALCSFVCPSKYDFGPVLRANLEQIEREG